MHHKQPAQENACAQAKITTVTTGGPRVFNPESAAWYNALLGVENTVRFVNNMDVVPSLPLAMTPLCAPLLALTLIA